MVIIASLLHFTVFIVEKCANVIIKHRNKRKMTSLFVLPNTNLSTTLTRKWKYIQEFWYPAIYGWLNILSSILIKVQYILFKSVVREHWKILRQQSNFSDIQFFLEHKHMINTCIPVSTSNSFLMHRCDDLTMCQLYHEILPDYCISQTVCDKKSSKQKAYFSYNSFLTFFFIYYSGATGPFNPSHPII